MPQRFGVIVMIKTILNRWNKWIFLVFICPFSKGCRFLIVWGFQEREWVESVWPGAEQRVGLDVPNQTQPGLMDLPQGWARWLPEADSHPDFLWNPVTVIPSAFPHG